MKSFSYDQPSYRYRGFKYDARRLARFHAQGVKYSLRSLKEKETKANIYDAAKILGLSGDLLPQDTKAAYRAACKKYHPDINPSGEDMMKVINEAYDALKDYTGEIKSDQIDYGDLLNDALNAVSNLPALVIEICGSWVWLTGDTRAHKDALKEAGFKWAAKKKAWYFRPEQFSSRSKGTKTLEEIRAKYGTHCPQRNNHMIARG